MKSRPLVWLKIEDIRKGHHVTAKAVTKGPLNMTMVTHGLEA